jgi:hypothetical protein
VVRMSTITFFKDGPVEMSADQPYPDKDPNQDTGPADDVDTKIDHTLHAMYLCYVNESGDTPPK